MLGKKCTVQLETLAKIKPPAEVIVIKANFKNKGPWKNKLNKKNMLLTEFIMSDASKWPIFKPFKIEKYKLQIDSENVNLTLLLKLEDKLVSETLEILYTSSDFFNKLAA